MSEFIEALRSIKIVSKDWQFSDLRIDIPPMSFGSDAANPHTQYSNAVAKIKCDSREGIGATFTLGEGNQFVCEGAKYIVSQLDGQTIGDIIDSKHGFAELLINPLQLRWLSPYSGIPMMSAGLIVNTVLDLASKRVEVPAWEFMSRLSADELLGLMTLRHLSSSANSNHLLQQLIDSESRSYVRCAELRAQKLPVYFTTWIGHDAESVSKQILQQNLSRGISRFKIKISPDMESDLSKLKTIRDSLPSGIELCVDANQTLSISQAKEWITALSDLGIVWLEEPFAPDNVTLFSELIDFRNSNRLSCEIVTGENCPNTHTAEVLIKSGIDRYQADPCRMMGLVDGLVTACLTKTQGRQYTPHAGGAGLDEMSLHLQLMNLARVDYHRDPSQTLTENVGFASHFYSQPAIVSEGKASVPTTPGLLVGFSKEIESNLIPMEDGISWVEL